MDREQQQVEQGRFRKKPVVINAHRFAGGESGWTFLMCWLESLGLEGEDGDGSDGTPGMWLAKGGEKVDPFNEESPEAPAGAVVIDTLEGQMVGSPGDWIIQGVQGEMYPCKPEIFAETYEAAS